LNAKQGAHNPFGDFRWKKWGNASGQHSIGGRKSENIR